MCLSDHNHNHNQRNTRRSTLQDRMNVVEHIRQTKKLYPYFIIPSNLGFHDDNDVRDRNRIHEFLLGEITRLVHELDTS